MFFSIWRNREGQFWFRIVGGNGETIAHSQMYTSKQSAQNSIETIRREAGNATVVDMTTDDRTGERP